MSIFKEILGILSLLSGPAMAVIAYLALKQIKIAKQQLSVAKTTFELSSKREAAVFTAKQCDMFAHSIIPKYSDVMNRFKEKNVKLYKLPSNKDSILDCEYGEWLKENFIKISDNNGELYTLITIAMNDIEAFSIYFIHKICDVNMAYSPIAKTYVEIVETLSPMICLVRNRDNNVYSNTIALYDIWKKKLVKESLEIKQKELYRQFIEAKKQASCIIEDDIKPIGLDEKIFHEREAVHGFS